MKLDNAQLAAFAAVVREGSFDAAARRLHVTTSAISQRIKLLEERLGQVLILRGNPCNATQAGSALLRVAEQIELLESELLHDLGVFGEDQTQTLRVPIAVNADSLDGWFLLAMEQACLHTNLTLDIRIEDQEYSSAMLREGSVMAAVSASPTPIQGCRVEYLGAMRYRALASPTYRQRYFATGVSEGSLSEAPMLVFNNKDGLQRTFLENLTSGTLHPPTHYLPSTRGFIEIAKRSMGWGMIPEYMAKTELQSGELVDIAPDRHLDVPLYWHCWRFASPTLEALSAAVRSSAKEGLHKGQDTF